MTLTPKDVQELKERYPNIDPDLLALNAGRTAALIATAQEQGTKRRSKYNVSAAADRTYNGILYDSKKEMRYYVEVLEPLLKAGELDYVLYHVRFPVGNDPVTIYEADFVTLNACALSRDLPALLGTWEIEVIEVKGMHTVSGDRKIKLFRKKYPKLKFTLIS